MSHAFISARAFSIYQYKEEEHVSKKHFPIDMKQFARVFFLESLLNINFGDTKNTSLKRSSSTLCLSVAMTHMISSCDSAYLPISSNGMSNSAGFTLVEKKNSFRKDAEEGLLSSFFLLALVLFRRLTNVSNQKWILKSLTRHLQWVLAKVPGAALLILTVYFWHLYI